MEKIQEKPTFTVDWFSRHVPNLSKYLGVFRNRPVTGLEIGSFEGMSSCWFIQNVLDHSASRLICIDPFSIPPWDRGDPAGEAIYQDLESRFDRNVEATRQGYRVVKMKGESSELLTKIKKSSISFAYIDGSHYSWDVLTDAVLAWPLLKRNGILVFDDYQYFRIPPNRVPEFPALGINAFLSAFEGRYKLLRKSSQVIIRKIR